MSKTTWSIALLLLIFSCKSTREPSVTEAELIQKFAGIAPLKNYKIKFVSHGAFGPQSFDYSEPDASYVQAEYSIDLTNKAYFAEHKRYNFPGEFIFWTKEFQRGPHSYRYDVNGVLYGKRVVQRDSGAYSRAVVEAEDKLSFMQLYSIFNTKQPDILQLKQKEQELEVLLTHQKDTLNLLFSVDNLRLKKLTNQSKNQKYEFRKYKPIGKEWYASAITFTDFDGYEEFTEVLSLENEIPLKKELLYLPKGHGEIFEDLNLPIALETVDTDLYVINNVDYDRHVMVKKLGKELMVLGAPSGREVTEEILSLLEEKFPESTIKYVYITHPHSDHIRGLPAYADAGVTILADAYSKQAILAFEDFEEKAKEFKFQIIQHREIVDGVQFFMPKNSHSKTQSFAYFPKEKVIYQGDFLEVPYDNSIPSYLSDVEREFITFLKSEALEYKRIVGHHRNNNIPPEVVDAYFEANQ